MASHASAGPFLCSEEFLNALSDNANQAIPKGKYHFKNVSEEREVFEIKMNKQEHLFIDPVCRMTVPKDMLSVARTLDSNFFFCSQNCREVPLKRNPLHIE